MKISAMPQCGSFKRSVNSRQKLIFGLLVLSLLPTFCSATDSQLPVPLELLKTGDSLFNAGAYDSALAVGEYALRMSESDPEREDSVVAKVLLRLGVFYQVKTDYRAAEATWLRALELSEKTHGSVHPDVVRALNYLGLYWRNKGKYSEAEQYLLRALDISEQIDSHDHSEVAMSLHNLALVRWHQGKLVEARNRTHRAQIIWEETLGPEHRNVASSLHLQGILYHERSLFDSAEYVYKRALAIREKTLGPNHPEVASSLTGLANVYYTLGNYEKAVPAYQRTLAIWRNRYGHNHPNVTPALLNLSDLCRIQGNYEQAAIYASEVIEIYRKVGEEAHERVGLALSRLGNIYLDQDLLSEAQDAFEQTRVVYEQALGPEHWLLARCLINLSIVYLRLGKPADAQSLLEQVLALCRRLYPNDERHPLIIDCLHSLGDVHQFKGDIDRAECLYHEVLSSDDHGGSTAPLTVIMAKESLAHLYVTKGDTAAATDKYEDFIQSRWKFLQTAFSISSEAQKLRWINKYPLIDGSLLTLALEDPNGRAGRLALEAVLNGKATVTDAVMAERAGAFGSCDDDIRSTLEDRASVCDRIASIVLSGLVIDADRIELKKLSAKKDTLETELSRMCSDFIGGSASRYCGLDDVIRAIPDETMLCEYIVYQPYDFHLKARDIERFGEPRYAVFFLDRSGQLGMEDLGPAITIDSLVLAARQTIYSAAADVYSPYAAEAERKLNETTRRLFDILFNPIMSRAAELTRLVVAPDGQLNLLPFEILPFPDGHYVVEDYRIGYISCGRDLVPNEREQQHSEGVLLLADPDFDCWFQPPGEMLSGITSQDAENSEETGYQPRPDEGCVEMLFSSMQASRDEVSNIASIIRAGTSLSVQLVTGADASEASLKNLDFVPRILHLATHGFFCGKNVDVVAVSDNPLLHSGLALAGANRKAAHANAPGSDLQDGILTALEVSAMNLYGTELTVLSACESGVGEVVEGEGLFGLRRAFQHAGCESIILSLWKVPDKATVTLITGFYERWLGGQSRIDALRGSSLELLELTRKIHGHGHPLIWGGFVLTGETE